MNKPTPKALKLPIYQRFSSIGAAGFEPTTSTTPKWRATKLRYAPNQDFYLSIIKCDRMKSNLENCEHLRGLD